MVSISHVQLTSLGILTPHFVTTSSAIAKRLYCRHWLRVRNATMPLPLSIQWFRFTTLVD